MRGIITKLRGCLKQFIILLKKLSREKYAFLTLKSLTSGEYRELTHEEVSRLNHYLTNATCQAMIK